MPNVYLVRTSTDLTEWYGTQGSQIGTTTPLVIPVDTAAFRGIQGLPQALTTFINQGSQAA